MSIFLSRMRPSVFFAFFILILATLVLALIFHGRQRAFVEVDTQVLHDNLTRHLGLTDLCLSTEARYTRHPAVTDDLAPFMDYPGALEYFPTGLFWAPR